ncbi:Scr1 family TA system antitoxin-like transcriptional regulator [Saccharopolyspora pogona]|uniref:Scr1 family TA system antitoxin-like transcriptional regulator n=1 Tax=Saccharopolyspora pogona TaxID=333966 RepID=UPI001CC22BEF|nr:Scr1 family TA system antitoxin-like transcriptional regulator [Saccharopolyspora pogona]
MRRERQERLDGDYPPRLHFYISEAVIRHPVGEADVWRGQLEHLIESSKLDHVELGIVPFSAGSHPGIAVRRSSKSVCAGSGCDDRNDSGSVSGDTFQSSGDLGDSGQA